MVENIQESTTGEETRALRILLGKCTCYLANRLNLRSEMDRAVIFSNDERVRRLGGFCGGLETTIPLSGCNGQGCLSSDQELTVARLFRQDELPFDEASANNLVRQATELGILPGESSQPVQAT
ncbi:MAG: hypothetical protein ABSB12_00015 [Candidatus Saccharimonadales bacterium]|jgi:hypothetical protein